MGRQMEELRDMLCEELDKIAMKGELTAGSLETIDKLSHSIKSIDTIMAMEDYSNDGGSYNSYREGNGRRSYAQRRDSRGRYSRARGGQGGGRSSRGYSMDEGKEEVMEQLEEMMEEAQDTKTRQAIKKAIRELDD